jgi:predicted SprT family Zn-dependent metalloprotease
MREHSFYAIPPSLKSIHTIQHASMGAYVFECQCEKHESEVRKIAYKIKVKLYDIMIV